MAKIAKSKFGSTKRVFAMSLVAAAVAAVSGCGGSSDSDSDDAAYASVSGTVFASNVAGANVSLLDAAGNVLAGPVVTNENGQFSLEVAESLLNAAFVLSASGGSYMDEATGVSANAGEMLLNIGAGEFKNGDALALTPGSTIIATLVREHGIDLSEARSIFQAAFGYQPEINMTPSDVTDASDASNEEKLAGLRAAVFSQLTHDMGLSAGGQFALLAAIAEDLADGALDGVNGAAEVQIDGADGSAALSGMIASHYVDALFNFRAGGRDHSALGNADIGSIPLATVDETASYIVTYGKLGMSQQGKSQFTLTITDKNGVAQAGLTPTLSPMMNMAMHSHSTPHEGCTETYNSGSSTCTVYYLMGSEMMNGDSMGYWMMDVSVNDETASFVPSVMMAMGDTKRAVLKGIDDTIAAHASMMDHGSEMMEHDHSSHMMSAAMDMAEAEPRSYYLFNDGVSSSATGHTLSLFIAAKNSMMSYPAVATGAELANGDMTMSISSIVVEASTDEITWVTAEEQGSGHYLLADIQGLTAGTEGQIKVRMTINGEQKTTDGVAMSDSNGYATFFVTPAE